MVCISIGKIDKNIITIILGCIICFGNRLLNQYDGTLLFDNVILTVMCISMSRFIAVIPFIIIKIRNKQLNKINIKNEDILKSFMKKNDEIIKYKWSFILFSGVIFFIQLFFLVLTFKTKTNSWIWYILISSLFYYLFFKVKLYKHHYLSAILIILIGFIIDLVTGHLQNDIKYNLLFLIFKYLKEILFSLYNVLAKYVMEKKYISVYEFSFYIGLINIILSNIYLVFDYYFFNQYNYKEYFDKFNTTELLVMLGVIFTQFGINITTLFTTKNSSPCHVFIIFVFGQLAYYTQFEEYFILVIICLIFILFLALIFNEIIEINIFGLSYNTRRNIVNRANGENGYIREREYSEAIIEKDEYLIELNEEENSKEYEAKRTKTSSTFN